TSTTSAATIVGQWAWMSGRLVEFEEDGTGVNKSDRDTCKWKCLDKEQRKYQATWSTGIIDWMLLSADGSTIASKNNRGQTFTAHRLPTDEVKPAQEPAALVKARKDYEAEVKVGLDR